MENTSAGRLCLSNNKALKVSYLIQCEIRIAETPAAIPTLAQVRWIQKNAKGFRYRESGCSSCFSRSLLPLLWAACLTVSGQALQPFRLVLSY